MKFHHVGVFCSDITRAMSAQASLGMTVTWQGFDSAQRAEIALLTFERGELLELIQPSEESAPSYKLFKRVGPGAYHFAYAVGSLDDTGQALRKSGCRQAGAPFQAIAFGGARAQFWFSAHVGLVELVELAA